MKRLLVVASALALILIDVLGCGSGIATSSPVSAATALKGNWLLLGTLPVSGPQFPLPTQFGLVMTLDVVNGHVFADASDFYPCIASGAGGAGGLTPGTIAADGTFTLQTQQAAGTTPTIVMTVHGTLPTTPGASWAGTYSATNANAGCVPVSGTFTAQPIQPVTGTFTGTGSLGPPNSVILTAPTLTIMFQQGGPSTLDPPAGSSPVNSVSALSGTITVGGSSCFTSGVANIPSGSVIGDLVDTQFTMNDGSRLLLTGRIADPAVSSIRLNSILVNGGLCDRWFGSSGTVLTKQ